MQRAVLARELSSEVDLLIVANPCFGLDFAAVAEIRARIVQARNRGAAVLLVSEDLDEILELSDRIVVMFDGKLALQTDGAKADVGAIGRAMAGHLGRGQDDRPSPPRPVRLTLPFDPAPHRADRHRHAARLHRARRLRRGAGQRREPAADDRADGAPPDRRFPPRRLADHPYPRMPQARPVRLPAGQACARQAVAAHRRSRPDGPHPDRRRAGRRHRAGAGPAARARSSSTSRARARSTRRRSATSCACAASPICCSPASPPKSACRRRCARPTTAATNACWSRTRPKAISRNSRKPRPST